MMYILQEASVQNLELLILWWLL